MTRPSYPERRLIGKCPSCGGGVDVETIYDRWPLITCGCGWKGGVPDVKHQQIEVAR